MRAGCPEWTCTEQTMRFASHWARSYTTRDAGSCETWFNCLRYQGRRDLTAIPVGAREVFVAISNSGRALCGPDAQSGRVRSRPCGLRATGRVLLQHFPRCGSRDASGNGDLVKICCPAWMESWSGTRECQQVGGWGHRQGWALSSVQSHLTRRTPGGNENPQL